MTEGTAIILLVIAELGIVLLIAGIAGAILWNRRRRREQQAMAALIAAMASRQDTRRVTLMGWLSHNLGYPQGEATSRADGLLEAETEIYRRIAMALHGPEAERLESIVAGMDVLTHLYRDTASNAPGEAAEHIAYSAEPAEADDELTKLDEADTPGAGNDAPPQPGGAGATASQDPDDLFGDGWSPAPEEAENAPPSEHVALQPAGDGEGQKEELTAPPPAESSTAADADTRQDTLDQTALDLAWEEALQEQTAGEEADEPATATAPPDLLDDLFDAKDDADGEPPVHR
ncbi:MAG: hypothetical protein U5S82_04865 [Gammaproteobacteria bacterium]|nr:hypothetical protein [Gammaproteobacteria bacterium]